MITVSEEETASTSNSSPPWELIETKPFGKLTILIDSSDITYLRIRKSFAFIFALILPIIFGALVSFVNISSNPLAFQLSTIMMGLLFCFYGILRRSKLEAAILNFPIAALSFGIMLLLNYLTNGWYISPYMVFSLLTLNNGPITVFLQKLKNLGISNTIISLVEILSYLFIAIDVLFLFILGLFIGPLITALFTRYRENNHKINAKTIILKSLAVATAIILLISISFSYITISKFSEGTAYLMDATTEFQFLTDSTSDLTALFQLNFSKVDITNPQFRNQLYTALQNVKTYLQKSYNAYLHVQKNYLAQALVSYLLPKTVNLDQTTAINVKNILKFVDILRLLINVVDSTPTFIENFVILFDNVNKTLTFIENETTSLTGSTTLNSAFMLITQGTSGNSNDLSYSPTFKQHLQNLTDAINALTSENQTLTNTINDISHILSNVFINRNPNKTNSVSAFIQPFEQGLPAFFTAITVLPNTINATYLIVLGLKNLLQNNFNQTLEWLQAAENDISNANTTLSTIDTNSLSGTLDNEIFPFGAFVEYINDFISVLDTFIIANDNLANLYDAMNSTLVLLDSINFVQSSIGNNPTWNQIFLKLNVTNEHLNNFQYYREKTSNLTKTYLNKDYGSLTDLVAPQWEEFNTALEKIQENTTDLPQLVTAFHYTINSTYHISLGLDNLELSLNNSAAIDNVSFISLNTTTYSTNNLTTAQMEINTSYDLLFNITFLSSESLDTWLGILKNNGNKSLYGIAQETLEVITTLSVTPQPAFNTAKTQALTSINKTKVEMENIQFSNVFK